MNSSPKNVILTGSRGLLGSAFVDYCTEQKIPFQILAPFPCSMSALRTALKDNGITHFINCAGYSNDKLSINNPYRTFDSNVHCVFNQLEAIKEWSPQTSYMNFGSIYEETRMTPYAASKRMSRELINSYYNNSKLNAIQSILSYTEYYKKDANRLLQNIIRKLIQLKYETPIKNTSSVLVLKNEHDIFNFTWATDVCRGTFDSMDKKTPQPCLISPGVFLNDTVNLITKELDMDSSIIQYVNDKFDGKSEIDYLYGQFDSTVKVNQIVKNLVEFELKQFHNAQTN